MNYRRRTDRERARKMQMRRRLRGRKAERQPLRVLFWRFDCLSLFVP